MKTLNEILDYTKELKKTMTEHGLNMEPVVLDFSHGGKRFDVYIFGVKAFVTPSIEKEAKAINQKMSAIDEVSKFIAKINGHATRTYPADTNQSLLVEVIETSKARVEV